MEGKCNRQNKRNLKSSSKFPFSSQPNPFTSIVKKQTERQKLVEMADANIKEIHRRELEQRGAKDHIVKNAYESDLGSEYNLKDDAINNQFENDHWNGGGHEGY